MKEAFYAFQIRGRTSALNKRINYRRHVSIKDMLGDVTSSNWQYANVRCHEISTARVDDVACSLILRNTNPVNVD